MSLSLSETISDFRRMLRSKLKMKQILGEEKKPKKKLKKKQRGRGRGMRRNRDNKNWKMQNLKKRRQGNIYS
jgi:hypothetical protein